MFIKKSYLSRRIVLFLTVLFGVTILAGEVSAKKKKNTPPNAIVMTNVQSFDKVFRQAQSANGKLKAAQASIRTSKIALRSALKLKKRSTYLQGLKQLKRRARGKIKVFMTQGKLQIKATDAVPTDVRKGIRAVNQLTKTIPSSLKNLKGVSTDSKRMAKQVENFPVNLQAELKRQGDNGLTLASKMPKATRVTLNNIKVIGSMPKRAMRTTTELIQITKMIQEVF